MLRAFAFLVVAIVFAALAGGLGYFQFVMKPQFIKTAIASAPQPVPSVSVVAATTESWEPRLNAIGTLRAVAGIEIEPQVGGVIKALHFDRGQDVAKGDVLVEIDDSVEQADLRANVATLKNADINLDRQKGLITGGNTAKATLDQAQAARDTAAAAVEKSKALIAQKVIIAPFSGRIGLRKGDIGQYVTPGISVANLQQLDPIYVDFPVPEQNLAAVKIGAEISVTVDAYPGRVFKGVVRALDARVSPDSRTALIRGELQNPDKTLLPGMFANVGLSTGAASSLVTIPRTGVSFSLYGDTIFVVQPAGDNVATLDRRVVKVGDTRGDRVAILDGLSTGEQIVSEGQLKLAPNMRVKIDNSAALPPPPSPRPKE